VRDAVQVLKRAADFVISPAAQALDFRALLANPSSFQSLAVSEEQRPLAAVVALVLRRLGGEYVELAQRLAGPPRAAPLGEQPAPDMPASSEVPPTPEDRDSPPTRLPVVFIPGFGGSFNLSVLLDWRDPTLAGWDFPPFLDYGKGLLDTFTRAGYTRDVNMFVAFYDWRKPASESVSSYLIPWIERARSRSGSDKVVLIGHHFGGLVARSYLQSTTYRGDVEHLITLGTPNRGAADTYYAWEGGELRVGQIGNTVLKTYIWYLEHISPSSGQLDLLKVIRDRLPSIRDMLPIDDYLIEQGPSPRPISEANMRERNLWAAALNTPEGLATLLGRARVTTISGTGFTTIQALVVQNPPSPTDDSPRYVDGKPISEQTSGDGDGLVLLASTQIDDQRVRNVTPLPIASDRLADQAAAWVLAELGVESPTQEDAPAAGPRLVIMVTSQARVTVVSPEGSIITPDAADRSPRPQRKQAAAPSAQTTEPQIISIPRFEIGTYLVRLLGTETGSFALGAMIVSEQGSTPISALGGQTLPQTDLHYQVECSSYAAQPQIRIDSQATARTGVQQKA
jgi:pimeloyl-ACP methyl ester carboxylesterase